MRSLLLAASSAALLTRAIAGFNSGSAKNLAVYWGQNSYNQGSGQYAQQRLSYYCQNSNIDIIPLAFMNGISPPIVNFANAGDSCTPFADNVNALRCPQIEEDIKTCQSKYGKTILISLGGATYTQGGWSSAAAAQSAAQMVWNMFGIDTNSGADRPFGSAVVDGFDFDFESGVSNLQPFAAKLRSLMDLSGKKMYLTAAPQCPFPDYANDPALSGGVPFDFVMVQYYNNGCGASSFRPGADQQWNFNFDQWDKWAKQTSANKNVKVLLGLPANTGAGAGYVSGSQLKSVINYCQQYSSFGGVMLWDMSQLYSNIGFLDELVSDLGSGSASPPPPPPPPATTLTTVTRPTTTIRTTPSPTPTSSAPVSSTGVPQWGQCGGQDYTGPTQCAAPYKCCYGGQWWSDCR